MKISITLALSLLLSQANAQVGLVPFASRAQQSIPKKASRCLEDKRVNYGGNFKAHNYTYFCPFYSFEYHGETSTKWDFLNPIDIMQIAPTLFPIKKKVERQIQDYAGATFFSRLEFSSVDVVYVDSVKKFEGRMPEVDMRICRAKYYFFYMFRADAQAVYNIGFAVNEKGLIISSYDFPSKDYYRPIDTTLTVCTVLQIAKKANPKLGPIDNVTFDYDAKAKRFYWIVSQSIQHKHAGINKFNLVLIDAAKPSIVKKQQGE
nr:hypothetical protein [Tanacetum cinerariifolium]